MPSTQNLNFSPSTTPTVVVPVSGAVEWVTAIHAGGLVVRDSTSAGAPVLNPAQISHSSRRVLVRAAAGGTTLLLRMVWFEDDVQTSILRVRVFGGMGTTDSLWTVLRNRRNESSVDISASPEDPYGAFVGDQASRGTIVDINRHAFDSMGFSHFLIGVERVYDSTGSPSTAYLQARMP